MRATRLPFPWQLCRKGIPPALGHQGPEHMVKGKRMNTEVRDRTPPKEGRDPPKKKWSIGRR